MKKTILALFAVLLVLSLAISCGDGSNDPAPSVTNDGKVTIAITVEDDTGTGRALTSGLGSVAANYYEVVFYDGTDYYQTTWGKGTGGGTITIQSGVDYGTANRAILFAGVNSPERILLGVGILTNTWTTSAASPDGTTLVSSTTKGAVFSVTSLTNRVNNTSTGANASTFQITGPATSSDEDKWSYVTNTGTNSFTPVISTADGYAIFRVPGYDTAGNSGLGQAYGSATDVTATYDVTVPYNAQVIADGATTATVAGQAVTGETTGTGTIGCTFVSATPTASGTTVTISNLFRINVTGLTAAQSGCYGFLIDMPVYPYRTTADVGTTPYDNTEKTTAVIWHIRGGSSLTTPDGNVTTAGNGALVLLAVGTHRPLPDGKYPIGVGDPNWP